MAFWLIGAIKSQFNQVCIMLDYDAVGHECHGNSVSFWYLETAIWTKIYRLLLKFSLLGAFAFSYAPVNSRRSHPPSGISRAFARILIPGVGHLKFFYYCPRGRAFAYRAPGQLSKVPFSRADYTTSPWWRLILLHPRDRLQSKSSFLSNGNRTEWSPIRSVIIRVITKSEDSAAGFRFV